MKGGGDKGSNPQARLETRLEIFDLVYFLQIYTCLILLYIYIWEKLEDTFRLKTRVKICSRFIYYCIGKKEKLDSLYTKLQRSDCALRIILVAIYLAGTKLEKCI